MELLTWPGKNEILVSRLQWLVLDPFADKLLSHVQIDQLISEGYRYFLKYKNGADVNIGITRSTALESLKDIRNYSVAANIATHPRFKSTTALVFLAVHQPEVEMVYAVGMVDGNVVMDEYLNVSELEAYYLKFSDVCESSRRSFMMD